MNAAITHRPPLVLIITLSLVFAGCGGGGSGQAPSLPLPATATNSGGSAKPFTPPKFTIVDLGANLAPVAINASGEIAGNDVSTTSIAFVYRDGTVTRFMPLPGDTQTTAYDIDNAGEAVGSSNNENILLETSHAVAFTGSSTHDLGSLANSANVATAINNEGTIVGWSKDITQLGDPPCVFAVTYAPGPPHGVEGWNDGGEPLALNDHGMSVGAVCGDPPDGEYPFAYPSVSFYPYGCCGRPRAPTDQANDVNERGDVVSQINDYNGYPHGWLTVDRTTLMEIPGLNNNNADESAYSFANALNDDDWVVGSATGNGQSGAMLYVNGTTYNLNQYVTGPGCSQWFLGNATDINDKNYIVGTGSLNGQPHGFLLIPQS